MLNRDYATSNWQQIPEKECDLIAFESNHTPSYKELASFYQSTVTTRWAAKLR